MTKKNEAATSNVASDDKSLRGLVLRSLLPSKEEVTREVLSKPKGTVHKVARIFGYATDTKSKMKTADDASVSEVISVEGVFRQDGGSRFSAITLTQAFSKEIKSRLETMAIVKIDVTVGLKNTGNAGAPYEWTVVSDIPKEQSDAMAAFSASKE